MNRLNATVRTAIETRKGSAYGCMPLSDSGVLAVLPKDVVGGVYLIPLSKYWEISQSVLDCHDCGTPMIEVVGPATLENDWKMLAEGVRGLSTATWCCFLCDHAVRVAITKDPCGECGGAG